MLLELAFQEVDQLFVSLHLVDLQFFVRSFCTRGHRHSTSFGLEFTIFFLQSLDNFLAEVGSLGEFLLYLLVDQNVSLQGINLSLHLVAFVD